MTASQAAAPATEEGRGNDCSRRPGRLQSGKDGLDVTGHLDASPVLHNDAVGIDEERASLDADDLAPVEVLFPDHVESVAQGLVRIAGQLELEPLLGGEVVVRLDRIAGHANHVGTGLPEL